MDEYLKAIGGVYAVIVEENGGNTYVAEAKHDTASASDPKWRVKRINVATSGTLTRTTVSWADGNPGFCHAANDMANLTYPNY